MKRERLALLLVLGLTGLLSAQTTRGTDKPTVARGAGASVAARASNRFAFDLYARLRAQSGNVFFSPFNLHATLAMTSAGARGQTLDQMSRVLHLPDQKQLHLSMVSLVDGVKKRGSKNGCSFQMSCNLWGQKEINPKADFLKITSQLYRAAYREVDFVRLPDPARKTINTWVEKMTGNQIRNLLPAGSVTTQTRLVAAGAVAFRGNWHSEFKKAGTRDMAFHVSPRSTVKVPMMYQSAKFPFARNATAKVLELPYSGRDLSMIVVLPNKENGLAEVEKSLTPSRLESWLKALKTQPVDVYLPRFRLSDNHALQQTLASMGLTKPFSPSADFSGIDSGRKLKLSGVMHQAAIDVDEDGCTATAATAVLVKAKSLDSGTPVFKADRPFLFLIRDRTSGAILFMGRLSQPARSTAVTGTRTTRPVKTTAAKTKKPASKPNTKVSAVKPKR